MSEGNIFSCMTCRLLVTNQELQREHYQSDWHRYNLKRKVASLPSVSLDVFLNKASAHEALLLAAESIRTQKWRCIDCKKHFACKKQLENHLISKKHIALMASRTTVARSQIPDTRKEIIRQNEDIEESLDTEPLEDNECLFCPIQSSDCEKLLQHMYLSHGFFIPFIDYIKDTKGLLHLLASLVGECFACIYCVNRSFTSVEAVQHHMRDKTHCKLDFDNTDSFCDQFGDFYDFSTSYPDNEQNQDQQLPLTSKLTLSDDMSLILPSGARVGHRAFKHIYKQHLTPSASRSLLLARPTAPSPVEYATKLRVLRERKQFTANFSKHYMRLGIKANKFQPCMRKQI